MEDGMPVVPASAFEGKKATQVDELVWVYANMTVRKRDVKPETCPSAGAWGQLWWARKDADNRTEFYKLYARVQAKVDPDGDRDSDDGCTVFDVIDRLERAVAAGEVAA